MEMTAMATAASGSAGDSAPSSASPVGASGSLLRLSDRERDGMFRVVAPDARLAVQPVAALQADAPCTAELKLVVTDAVSGSLLQVAWLSGVTTQRDTQSLLWVATGDGDGDGEELPAPPPPFVGPTVHRVCFCFHVNSATEFELIARTVAAAARLQRMSLLEISLRMEFQMHRHRRDEPCAEAAKDRRRSASSAESHPQKQLVLLRPPVLSLASSDSRRPLHPKGAPAEPTRSPKLSGSRAGTPESAASGAKAVEQSTPNASRIAKTPSVCVLCGTDQGARGVGLVKHPFVLKDARGAAVLVCKICLQQVLKRWVAADALRPAAGPGTPRPDSLCGLCAESAEAVQSELKACAHPQCPRVYCSQCLKKLIGRAQVHKVWRTKRWSCPNCTPDDGEPLALTKKEPPAPVAAARTPSPSGPAPKKKRRRQPEAASEDLATQQRAPLELTPQTTQAMTLVDYAANYFAFVTGRENQQPPPDESEDVCFCCRDGGDLIECDWETRRGVRCPKVYHEDCLGFAVPEKAKWICPRHRCYQCGFPAAYSCRFCVTSYCKDHLLKEIKKLGPASRELEKTTYVLCTKCDQMSLTAVEEGKVSGELLQLMLHAPTETPSKKKGKRDGGGSH
ncbi:hypothetical protein ATCC90586_007939 [Pythium insidiosum]|nr:hypothetical protein ATCC90586_007939 [Pythium insidiosum]